jgi:G3E family GTPase
MFIQHIAAQRRMPVVLLSGFLGSGKTTLVNSLLRDPRLADTAVAVNEFGEIPLDQHLIAHGGDRAVVLANGCLCCRLSGEFEDAVMRIFARSETGELPRFTRLIIEPSGLADPTPIAQAILRNPILSAALRLEAIVTTVDAILAETQLVRHPEMRKQIALADRLVLTKTDQVDSDAIVRVTQTLRALNPLAPVLSSVHGLIDAETVLPASFVDHGAAGIARPARRSGLFAELIEAGGIAEHGTDIEAVSLTADAPLRWRAFDAWLRSIRIGYAEQVLRIKGLMNITGSAGPIVIQGVGHVLHAPIALARWPTEDRRSRIVFISQGVAPGAIRQSWRQALSGLLVTAEYSGG